MDDEMELDFSFDNDASASSFGWNFQVNAGIFLFLHYIKEAKAIKVESKYEDIEITLKDCKKVFAQAKSSQDECSVGSAKGKFKDAIISLSKIPMQDGNILIYISNIREPIKGGDKFFENKVVSYDECLTGIKANIEKSVDEIVKRLDKKIQSKSTTEQQKKKYQYILANVKKLSLDKLCICSIYPYYGIEKNRYSEIKTKIIEVLVNDIHIGTDDAIGIAQKLLEHWQLELEHNSTIKDNTLKKNITKEEFIWPIAVYLSEIDGVDIDDCLTYVADNSIKKEAYAYMQSPVNIYHERFPFVNSVLRDYEEYKNKTKDMTDAIKVLVGKYEDANKEYQTQLLNAIKIPLMVYSGRIIQNYPLGLGIRAVIKTNQLVFEAASKSGSDVYNILSTGQLNGLSIALLLSIKNVYGDTKGLDILLIDDPLQTIDDISAISLADLLTQQGIGQIVLSTHEEAKAALLRYKFKHAGMSVREQNMQALYMKTVTEE